MNVKVFTISPQLSFNFIRDAYTLENVSVIFSCIYVYIHTQYILSYVCIFVSRSKPFFISNTIIYSVLGIHESVKAYLIDHKSFVGCTEHNYVSFRRKENIYYDGLLLLYLINVTLYCVICISYEINIVMPRYIRIQNILKCLLLRIR